MQALLEDCLLTRENRHAKSYLDLGQDMDDFWNELPGASGIIRRPNIGMIALNDRRVVTVSRNGEIRRGLVSRPDHFKQALVLIDAIDGPSRVEDLVSAMPVHNSEQPTHESQTGIHSYSELTWANMNSSTS